jgi:hypothetical protein
MTAGSLPADPRVWVLQTRSMSVSILVLLVVLWTVILVPSALRGRYERSPATSVDSFERSMSILAADLRGRASGASSRRAPGRRVLVVADPRAFAGGGASRRRTLHRRKLVLQGLVAAAAVTAVAAIAIGGVLITLFYAVVVALLAYVGGLVWIRANAQSVRRTVRRLPVRPAATAVEGVRYDDARYDDARYDVPLAAGQG